jgi:hypothetical protein
LSARSWRRATAPHALTACPPLQIVNGEHDDLTAGLQSVEQVQQPNSSHHRVGPGLCQDPRLQLIDDPIGEQRLCLVTADLENDSVRQRTEEPGKQSRLASPSLALHIDHLRLAHLGRSKPLTQDAQFALPTDETGRGTHAESTGISCIKEQPPCPRQAVPGRHCTTSAGPWEESHAAQVTKTARGGREGKVFLAIADHL